MLNIPNKANWVDTLSDTEFNSLKNEPSNLITGAGLSLDGADSNQAGKAVATYSANNFYVETGASVANAYILQRADNTMQNFQAYKTGTCFSWLVSHTNTATSTLRVDSLAVKTIKKEDGSDLTGGELVAGYTYKIRYDGTNFVLVSSAKMEIDKYCLGVGQTWQNKTSERAVGTLYTNTTGKPIEVKIVTQHTADWVATLFVDGLNVDISDTYATTSAKATSVSAMVPNGSTFRVTLSSGIIIYWFELRS